MDRSILVKKYFEDYKFVESNIQSFNNLLEKGLQEVVEENKEAEPTIIPHNIEKFKIVARLTWKFFPAKFFLLSFPRSFSFFCQFKRFFFERIFRIAIIVNWNIRLG